MSEFIQQFRVYVSRETDPYLNLAYEAWLYEHAPLDLPILFLWQNQSTVVIGRAQNPWVECHMDLMRAEHIQLARRVSGGGAVFHDLGNSNFTFIQTKDQYDRSQNLQTICQMLAMFGVHARISGRNDLEVLINSEWRKISGSAFRESQSKCLHHGTLLMNANLNQLARYLHPSPKKLAAKGVKSVRSRVMNLVELAPTLSHPAWVDACLRSLTDQRDAIDIQMEINTPEDQAWIEQKRQDFASTEWRLGKTLPFTEEIHERYESGEFRIQLQIDKGVIIDAQGFTDDLEPDEFQNFAHSLISLPYDSKKLYHHCIQHPFKPASLFKAVLEALTPNLHAFDVRNFLR